MRAGLSALRLGHFDLARETFDRAIAEVESLQEGAEQAKRAKSRFVGEREKWFKGENHERAALYLYRGLLYLRDQDFGNAAACFKRAQLQDITGDDAPDFAGDWFSAEWALALASLKNGFPADADAARQRAETFPHKPNPVLWPGPNTTTLIIRRGRTRPAQISRRQPRRTTALRQQPQPHPSDSGTPTKKSRPGRSLPPSHHPWNPPSRFYSGRKSLLQRRHLQRHPRTCRRGHHRR
ncbi:MAG: hypothetical protein HC904_11965 [Blastochloris sp.]|nr:hypothetical protein [Blastochloris sp.]